MPDYEMLFKFILIGDSNVGKSCLLLRFLEGKFKSQHEATLGVQFGSKIVQLDNKKIKLQVWDTAGQESFKSITRSYYKNAIAALLFFDLSQESTFKSAKRWLSQLRTYSHQKLRIVLIGSKADLADTREVSEEQIKSFMKENKIETYFQTSALSGLNIEEPFMYLANQTIDAIQKGQISERQSNFGIVFKNKKNISDSPYVPITPSRLQKKSEKGACEC